MSLEGGVVFKGLYGEPAILQNSFELEPVSGSLSDNLKMVL